MNGAVPHPDLLVGFEHGDDAAVYRLDDHVALVLTVDFFAPIVDDPFTYGAIAAANSLSDVYAVGGRPITALNIAAFPRSLPSEIPSEILRGGAAKVAEAGAIIVGGHTVDDVEPKYGLSVVGIVEPGRQVQNSTAEAGDVLVLTKPLGTGVVTTALKNGEALDEILDAAVDSMLRLNRDAAEAMVSAGGTCGDRCYGFRDCRSPHDDDAGERYDRAIEAIGATGFAGCCGVVGGRCRAGWDASELGQLRRERDVGRGYRRN